MIELTVNGRAHRLDIEADTPLLWALRDHLDLLGTKYGCGVAQCGACSVLVDGQAMRSCSVPVEAVVGMQVTTIEAIAADPVGAKVTAAWIAADVPQCGYCQSGQVVAATALLKQTPKPSDAEITEAMTNLCRCGTYIDIAGAIRAAAAA
ncbi:(2Fe-2S)-binding protein [Humitalea sp. 24SJ18S-53]|uniref:(2Fe-2S)-binding protein n=1 Tax=Humitalea sp. 24SJ18S-53 TaxID=3422307 RepID=UPI003D667BD4